ncbi:ABC transporter ATP-binding protein [Streptomyces tagetis]|uniref:ABC-type quaternary amine transporter n=1 Tax=Streptomyces tagetis TaxID=2820809 RepID=A0A941B0B6_9ACTN|nr:ABC transporter ATP-binding protein [Streptomyces sp. RG38]MBQ0826541.1 ABC transporter ATP-binding protein [Streptomyces sp. RG38]
MRIPVLGTDRQTRRPASEAAPPAAPPAAGGRIRLDGLGKRFGSGAMAVSGVDLDIAPGEFITLLGPSGSGKTTTLNMIAGFTDPSEGRILLNDQDISPLPPHRRNFGMVFQSYALFPHLTVAQNIAFPLRERRLDRAEITRRVGEVVELTDLRGKENRRPHELSGGQQQRVALARAVVFSPSVLLLDEPLSALDRKLRQSLQREIKRLHDELRLTFVFVTHDQDEAMTLSDRIAVFREGRLDAVGTPDGLYHDPGTRFVAQFLGESNLFEGTAGPDGYRWRDRVWPLGRGAAGTEGRHLVVRPEKLGVIPAADPVPSGHSTAPATVTDVSFYGTYQRVELRYDDESPGCVVRPAQATPSVTAGEAVLAHWRPEDQVFVTP